MHIRRLTITLPARMKHGAHHEARAIGEAIAQALHANGGEARDIALPGHGQSGLTLAARVGAALPKPRGGQGHGG